VRTLQSVCFRVAIALRLPEQHGSDSGLSRCLSVDEAYNQGAPNSVADVLSREVLQDVYCP
jgi:hypothetical protein